jgi:hypothetical protein
LLLFSRIDSRWFQHLHPNQRETLPELVDAAKAAQNAAIVPSTMAKHARSWTSWRSFLKSIGVPDNDPFLDNFSSIGCHQLLSAFTATIRDSRFQPFKAGSMPIKAESCAAALGHVVQAFKASDRLDPRLAHDGKTSSLLQRQLKG